MAEVRSFFLRNPGIDLMARPCCRISLSAKVLNAGPFVEKTAVVLLFLLFWVLGVIADC